MTAAVTALPSNWALFVEHVILGSDPADAARDMGYSNPKQVAVALLKHPQVRKALASAAEARLEGVSVPLALNTIDEILQDKEAPKAVRAKLALGVLARVQRTEHGGPSSSGKSLADMTPRELEQLVAQLGAAGLQPGQMLDVTPRSAEQDDTIP